MPVRTLRKPQSRIRIMELRPQLDCGQFAVKRTVGERVHVSVTIVRDGHDVLGASLLYRGPGKRRFASTPLEPVGNNVFAGSFEVTDCGRWEYAVEAWSDRAATFRDELRRKVEAGQDDLSGELAEGEALLGIPRLDVETALASTATDRDGLARSDLYAVEVDRKIARFGAWYELFPRSFGGFTGVERVLPKLAEFGFDVVYLPPIHPIGRSGRKGRNNTLPAKAGDPGSPWAIGAKEGGHDAVDPSLGTLGDFDRLVARAQEFGLEIALDFAIQCSPDHPWLEEHPEWFQHRPDGTIKFAENPPKRYQDIVNVDWECDDWQSLWEALRDVVLHWVGHGVRIFRVDNPHTKPLPFWEWLITEVRRDNPDVVFLAEAFTRPPMMQALAKLGFNQSYTYFTWKNSRAELEDYVRDLVSTADYYRPNFFANTPDILHEYLQRGGRPAFEARLVLAATLSPSYGIYSGFENIENVPVKAGSEEYLDSEKYEVKTRALDGPLLPLVHKLNEIRRANRSLQQLGNVAFLDTANEHLIAYAKQSDADTVIVVVNLDPFSTREGLVTVSAGATVQDLLTDETYRWSAGGNFVRLGPGQAHVLHVR
ncbi:MAG TPA: alpha-1,4-glucan--maltose-1-phosphate maltosyltransferase [Gaiellaceae bacterium]